MSSNTCFDRASRLAAIDRALDALSAHNRECLLCPRDCGVDRDAGETGFCGIGPRATVASALLHFGEEPVLSGVAEVRGFRPGTGDARRGSGTVFFTGCSLQCLFCQNHQISRAREQNPAADDELAAAFLGLQRRGALNLNLVTPSHVLMPILRALRIAVAAGFRLPVVYNCGGYEKADVLRFLEGIVDIWLPDLKYHDPGPAGELSRAPDYFRWASEAVVEMYCQQPRLETAEDGSARRGLIVRHLVLPGGEKDSIRILEWMAHRLSPTVGLSLMSQFRPCFRTPPAYDRNVGREEYRAVLDAARRLGFETIFAQPEPFAPDEHLVPDFSREKPFDWGADDDPSGKEDPEEGS